jgi:hypothetical protein
VAGGNACRNLREQRWTSGTLIQALVPPAPRALATPLSGGGRLAYGGGSGPAAYGGVAPNPDVHTVPFAFQLLPFVHVCRRKCRRLPTSRTHGSLPENDGISGMSEFGR